MKHGSYHNIMADASCPFSNIAEFAGYATISFNAEFTGGELTMQSEQQDNCVSKLGYWPVSSGHRLESSPWYEACAADLALCETFAERYNARLVRSMRSQRVGWRVSSGRNFGLLLPDELPQVGSSNLNSWRVFVNSMETIVHWSEEDREKHHMLILPDAAEDWMELIRQAVYREVYDIAYVITPMFLDSCGEVCCERTDYYLEASSASPGLEQKRKFKACGSGSTPECAARDLCREWLRVASQQ